MTEEGKSRRGINERNESRRYMTKGEGKEWRKEAGEKKQETRDKEIIE